MNVTLTNMHCEKDRDSFKAGTQQYMEIEELVNECGWQNRLINEWMNVKPIA